MSAELPQGFEVIPDSNIKPSSELPEGFSLLSMDSKQDLPSGYEVIDPDPIQDQPMIDEQLSSSGVIEKTPEQKTMGELVGEKVEGFGGNIQNLGAAFGERASDVAGNLVGGFETISRSITDFVDENRIELSDNPQFRALQESLLAGRDKQIGKMSEVSEDLKGFDLGYKETMGSEQLKESYRNKGLTDPSFYVDVAKFGLEQGVKSIPDMIAISQTLPVYALSKIEEMSQTHAQNDGRDKATLKDFAMTAPFAIGSIAFDSMGMGAMSSAFKKAAGDQILKAGFKEAAKRVAKAGAKGLTGEAATEAIQEGIIEYIGEKWGTDAKMDVWEAFERGGFGALAGGLMGGAVSTAGGVATELTQKQEVTPEEAPAPDDIVPGEVIPEEVIPEETVEVEPEIDTDFEGTGLTEEEAVEAGATGKAPSTKVKAEDQSTVEDVLRGALGAGGIKVKEGDVWSAFDQKEKYGQGAVDKASGALSDTLAETFPDRFDPQKDEPVGWLRENFGEDTSKKIIAVDYDIEQMNRDEATPYILQGIEEGVGSTTGEANTVENILGDNKRVKIYFDGDTYSLTRNGESIFLNGKYINKTDVTGKSIFAGAAPVSKMGEVSAMKEPIKKDSAYFKGVVDGGKKQDYTKLTDYDIDKLHYQNGIKEVADHFGIKRPSGMSVTEIRAKIKEKIVVRKRLG